MATAVIALIALAGVVVIVSPATPRLERPLRAWLDECGLAGISLGSVVVVLVALALTVSGVVAVLVPIAVLAPIALVASLAIPIAALDAARSRRRTIAQSRWPDVIDTMRMSLRAGASLPDAFHAAQAQVPREWQAAWSTGVSGLVRGAGIESVVRVLRAELAEPIADRVCDALVIAHELGGTELPRILEELARSARDDVRLRREATSRQSWVRHAARLGSAAPWVLVVLLGSRPENRDAFSGQAGTALLVACAGATVVAYIVMTALGRIPEAPRWVIDD
ncbi:MAG: type II secretion system F family protein [Microbacteriaceae bacterium]